MKTGSMSESVAAFESRLRREEHRMSKRVVTRKVTGVGWDGNLHVRLDLAIVTTAPPTKATAHVYLEPDDPLAGLAEGTEVVVIAGSGLIEALRAKPAAAKKKA